MPCWTKVELRTDKDTTKFNQVNLQKALDELVAERVIDFIGGSVDLKKGLLRVGIKNGTAEQNEALYNKIFKRYSDITIKSTAKKFGFAMKDATTKNSINPIYSLSRR
jgi:hypothetical protein